MVKGKAARGQISSGCGRQWGPAQQRPRQVVAGFRQHNDALVSHERCLVRPRLEQRPHALESFLMDLSCSRLERGRVSDHFFYYKPYLAAVTRCGD